MGNSALSIIVNNPTINSIKSLFILLLLEVALTFFIGLEMYSAFVILLLTSFFLLILIEPLWGLIVLLLIVVGIEGKLLEEFILFRLFGFNWYLIDFLLLLFFISFSVRVFYGQYDFKINKISFWIFIFFITTLISLEYGMKAGHSISEVFHDFRGFFYYIIFFTIPFLINSEKRLKSLFIVILIIGTLKCGIDIIQSLYFMDKTYDTASREVLTFARLTGYSEIIYPIIFFASIAYSILSKNIFTKIVLIPSILLSGIALFLSFTRGSWLAAFITFAVFFLILIKTNRTILKLSSVIYVIGGFTSVLLVLNYTGIFSFSAIMSRFLTISTSSIDVSNLGRLVEWATAIEAFVKNPMLGAGFGFKYNYFAPGTGYLSTTFVHNSYLYVLSKMGLIGLIPFLMILLSSISLIRPLVKEDLKNDDNIITFIFLMILILISVKSLTTWHLNTWTFSIFVGLIFGILYRYQIKIEGRRKKIISAE